MSKYVIRYVPTYIGKNGIRTLAVAHQGRNTFATAPGAQNWIDGLLENNPPDQISQIFGGSPQFEVRPCECYPGHFDPVGLV